METENLKTLVSLLNRFAHANASAQLFLGCGMVEDMFEWMEKSDNLKGEIIDLFIHPPYKKEE